MTAITVEGTTATVGTGPVTINAAPVSGYAAWNTMPAGVYPYALLDGRASESGWGGWDGAHVLTRIAITHSTNIGNPIALSGNAAIVVLQVSGAPQPGSAYIAKPPGVLLSASHYTASGPITILGPTGRVRMFGGAGSAGLMAQSIGTGGTGAPGYLEKALTNLTAGNTLTFTCGVGGAAAVSLSHPNGNDGTASILASGTQTIGTLTANGTKGSLAQNASVGTSGGAATGGDVNMNGNPGSTGSLGGSVAPIAGFPGIGPGPYCFGQPGTTDANAVPIPGNNGGLYIDWYSA